MLVEFDFIFAKARYGERLNAVKPIIREDGSLHIYQWKTSYDR